MNVTPKLSFMQDETKVLGSGEWYVDNDDAGSFCYSGIWQGGKVIALVLDEHSDSEVVKERGNLIVKAVNSHKELVDALSEINRLTNDALTFGSNGNYRSTVRDVLVRASQALAAAGEPT